MQILLIVLSVAIGATPALAQGVFAGGAARGRTRIGAADGPFAGTNIWGQFLAGPTSDSLVPVGNSTFHQPGGEFALGVVPVPGAPAFTTAFVQLLAWDGTAWGSDLLGVPADQIGRTDIVSVFLSDGISPLSLPMFSQPAIVPIPEPSTWALLAFGTFVFWCMRCRRR